MTKGRGIRGIDLMVVLFLAGALVWWGVTRTQDAAPAAAFHHEINLGPLFATAVQNDGRLRSFESHARTFMGRISGAKPIFGQSYGFTYLDMIFRPHRYHDADIVLVKNKNVREKILDVLAREHATMQTPAIDVSRAEGFRRAGLISPDILHRSSVVKLLQELGADLIRTAKVVDAIQTALMMIDPGFLEDQLRVVAAPKESAERPWYSIIELSAGGAMPSDDVHAGLRSTAPISGVDDKLRAEIAGSWDALRNAWRAENADGVNQEIARLAELFPKASGVYPTAGRLSMESWYFRNQSMTWVWMIYMAGAIPLLMAVIYRWAWARKVGMFLFVAAFLAHTASLGIRWYISGRWPNANMFEAVTTSAWFGTLAAVVLEWFTRRTVVKNLFALSSSAAAMAALMAAYFLPAQLDSTISNKMAALNDIWIYIHTNMIILSYALIALACVPALLQLRHRWCEAWDGGYIDKWRLLLLPVAIGVFNYSGYLLLMHILDDPQRKLSAAQFMGHSGAFIGSFLMLFFEALSAGVRWKQGIGLHRSAAGGAASLILSKPGRFGSGAFLKEEAPTVSQVMDGATMVLVELSFITLWTGLVMGAIWADHSWGRPWGWDPKEVFALNTFIILLILVHVRLKVKDRAFWTAVLAVVGFEVMMFNWIVVNFIISGLHSYA